MMHLAAPGKFMGHGFQGLCHGSHFNKI